MIRILILILFFPSFVFSEELETKVVPEWGIESQEELANYITNIVKPHYTIEEIQAVGSRMFGGFRIDSDLDIVVQVKEDIASENNGQKSISLKREWKNLSLEIFIEQTPNENFLRPVFCQKPQTISSPESFDNMIEQVKSDILILNSEKTNLNLKKIKELEELVSQLKQQKNDAAILQKQIENTDFCRYLPAYSLTEKKIREHPGKNSAEEIRRHQEHRARLRQGKSGDIANITLDKTN